LLNSQPGGLPNFQESSSSELTELLSQIRQKRIFPFLLNTAQQKLIRSRKMISQLENEPVYATIGGEEIRLEHIELTTDVPPQTAFLRVLDLTQTPQDWNNILPLLEGWHHSKPLPGNYQQRLIVAATEAGRISILLQCLQQAETNGFSLASPVVRLNMFHAIRKTARDAEWAEEPTHKCLKHAQQVVDLMEEPAHCGGKRVTSNDPRAQPYVIGIPLEIAATRVKNHLGGVDEDGLVSTYTTRLLAALEQPGNDLVRLHFIDTIALLTVPLQTNDEYWTEPDVSDLTGRKAKGAPITISTQLNKLSMEYLPVRSALVLARDVLGSSAPREVLDSITSNLERIDVRLGTCTQAMLERNKAVLELKGMTDNYKYAYPSMEEAVEVLGIRAA
jgi:hypothetical protein